MSVRFEMREALDPWRGRQPRYEKLVMAGPQAFHLVARLPSGERIAVPLGRPSVRPRRID